MIQKKTGEKNLDPAIGSGAFPVSILLNILKIKETLNPDLDRAETKRKIIENSIYGVDIARLRFWLSLIIDENDIKPLPNLDYKIICGDSLLTKFENEVITIDLKTMTNSNFRRKLEFEIFPELKFLLHDFFNKTENKNDLKLKIKNLKIEIIETFVKDKIETITKSINKLKSNLFGINKKEKTELDLKEIEKKHYENILNKLEIIKNSDKPLHFFDFNIDFYDVFSPNISPAETRQCLVSANKSNDDSLLNNTDNLNNKETHPDFAEGKITPPFFSQSEKEGILIKENSGNKNKISQDEDGKSEQSGFSPKLSS